MKTRLNYDASNSVSKAARFMVLCAGLAIVGVNSSAYGDKLVLNGKPTAANVKTVNGQAMVSLHDLAKAMGMVVVKSRGRYELKKAGGTYQVQDLNGKVGDVLFDGKWRFQVLGVENPVSFTMRSDAQPYRHYNSASFVNRVFRPNAGFKLVVVKCRVTNGQKTRKTLWTAISDQAMNTALTDFDGGNYLPLSYDYDGGPNVTQPLLPGASLSFPIIFSVPEETQLKDLVFTLKNNESFTKGTDVRVSLR